MRENQVEACAVKTGMFGFQPRTPFRIVIDYRYSALTVSFPPGDLTAP